jgi:hypothetical protein
MALAEGPLVLAELLRWFTSICGSAEGFLQADLAAAWQGWVDRIRAAPAAGSHPMDLSRIGPFQALTSTRSLACSIAGHYDRDRAGWFASDEMVKSFVWIERS